MRRGRRPAVIGVVAAAAVVAAMTVENLHSDEKTGQDSVQNLHPAMYFAPVLAHCFVQ